MPARLLVVLRRLRAAFARWVPLTGLGRAALIGLAVSLLLGWWAGWVEFRALAAGLGLALAGAVVWTLRPGEYAGTLRLDTTRARVGEQVLGGITVTNPGRRRTLPGRVHVPVGRAQGSFAVPGLPAGGTHDDAFHVRTSRRAIIGVGPITTVAADPLGLIRRVRDCAPRVDLFVHPEVVRLESTSLGFLRDVEGVATQNLSSSDVAFATVREYHPGDDRRSIHWRTTARTGRLMVRQFEETMRSHLLLILSLRADDYASAADFELAVSCAGSLALAADTEGREVSLYTSAGPAAALTARAVLDQLCGVELVSKAPTLRQTASRASAVIPTASIAALVTGSVPQASDLRAAHVALPPSMSALALRCGQSLSAARRSIGGLAVLDLAALTELPGGLRTVR